MKKLILPLLFLLTACNSIDKYKVYSWWAVSSGPNELPFIRGINPDHIQGGWAHWFNTPGWEDQKTITEREILFKGDGIFIWLPFGRNLTGDFDFAAYTQSLKDPRLAKITDIDSFVAGCMSFLQTTKLKKVWFYYGYVGADTSVWAGLSTEKKKDLVEQNLAPIVALKSKAEPLGIKVGVIIDTLTQRMDPNDDNWTIALPAIKAHGLMYGGEPWPNSKILNLMDSTFMSVFVTQSTWLFDPDFDTTHGTWNTWSAPLNTVKSPIASIMFRDWANGNYTDTLEIFREKSVFSLKKYKSLAFTPPDDPTQTALNLKRLAGQDGTQCFSQNGVKRCCTSVGETLTCDH